MKALLRVCRFVAAGEFDDGLTRDFGDFAHLTVAVHQSDSHAGYVWFQLLDCESVPRAGGFDARYCDTRGRFGTVLADNLGIWVRTEVEFQQRALRVLEADVELSVDEVL